jgi:3-oxoacyl-[acyl-carrier protein] reductase
MKLQNRVALVTGASRGIGAAVAKRLARDGAKVALVYKSRADAAAQVADEIRRNGSTVALFQADVTDEAALQVVAREAAAAFTRIDVLVHCAGTFVAAPVGEIRRDDFDDQFAMHAWSTIAATQAVLPHFGPQGGAIVNVSTSLVARPQPGLAVYTAAKAAVDLLTRNFALELGPRGIRVNAVAPAVTRTDMTAGLPADAVQQEIELTPLGRVAEPEDIADAVAFLASDDARWVTGRTLLVDGGRA